MRDTRGVSLGQAVGDLDGDVKDLAQSETTSRDQLAKRLSIHELHGDEVEVFNFGDIEYGDDVGMIQCGGGAGLLFEAFQALRVLGELSAEHLDGDGALQLEVLGFVDFSHAAGADEG